MIGELSGAALARPLQFGVEAAIRAITTARQL